MDPIQLTKAFPESEQGRYIVLLNTSCPEIYLFHITVVSSQIISPFISKLFLISIKSWTFPFDVAYMLFLQKTAFITQDAKL